MNVTSPSVTSGMLLAGKYRVDRMIGEGGMGVVLAATNEALRQRVAIKLLRSGALANAKALGRFEREARAAASLRSEHVARVLDVGKLEDGRPYMVMEYLDGRDLGDVIDRGPPIPVGEVVDYVLQACEAVAEAHAAGIVHRDLKPKNLFLAATVDGRPLIKVLDFGISKMEDSAEDMSLTRTTEIIGSPSYMSPEQLHASKDVDARTDIWALGVILYELLTKKVPFMAMTVTQLVAVVLTEPAPDVRVVRPDVPEGLAFAIMRCLSKKREERFASVAELVHTIAPAGTGQLSSMVDRIYRVAQGSGRLPPTTGSGPYAVIAASGSSSQGGGGSGLTAGIALTAGMPIPPTASGSGPHYNGNTPPPVGPSGIPLANPNAPPPASSARLAIHGGTSVAWGETQVDRGQGKPRRRSVLPIVGIVAALVILLGVAGIGISRYVRFANATTPATQPGEPIVMPPGRKDLPPLASAGASGATLTPIAPGDVPTPTALPSSRVPTSEGRTDHLAHPGDPKAPKPARPAGAAGPPPVAPNSPNPGAPNPAGKPPDDLSNIGRR
jgi:serine/threonine protein kinase